MATEQFFLGVDAGGTGCRVRLVAASGLVLGEGRAGAANIRLGLDVSWRAILSAIDQALSAAGLGRAILSQTYLGLGTAGLTGPTDIDRTRDAAPILAGIAIETDAHTACLGAFSGRDGAILSLGTGSVGYAIIGGVTHSIGGWGFEVSDDGSGAAIGREAIRRALRAYDGLEPASDLTQAVMTRLGGDPAGVLAWVARAKPGDYGSFTPLVLEFALTGDAVGVALMSQAAGHAENFIRRLGDLGATRIGLVGGLGAAMQPWLNPWARQLLSPVEGDAVDGALLLARQAVHTHSPPPH